jgi:hypothetical protein
MDNIRKNTSPSEINNDFSRTREILAGNLDDFWNNKKSNSNESASNYISY